MALASHHGWRHTRHLPPVFSSAFHSPSPPPSTWRLVRGPLGAVPSRVVRPGEGVVADVAELVAAGVGDVADEHVAASGFEGGDGRAGRHIHGIASTRVFGGGPSEAES